jgi:hypothetical protein
MCLQNNDRRSKANSSRTLKYPDKFFFFSHIISLYTVCFTDLGKLNLIMVVQFKLKPIFSTLPAASKITLASKLVKIDSK